MAYTDSTINRSPPSSVASEVHWVKPSLPTALPAHEFLTLPNSDAIFLGIDAIWLFPGLLNIPRLKEALSLTLRDCPHLAGRLAFDEESKLWRIRLVNDAIPLTVSKNHDIDPTDSFMTEPHPELADTLETNFEAAKNHENEPLIKFRVTEWTKTGETSIAMSVSHCAGDALAMFHIMVIFSAYYTGEPAPPTPTFEKYLDPVPSCPRSQLTTTLPYLSLLAIDYRAEELMKMNVMRYSNTERVELRITRRELDKLKERVIRTTGDGTLSSMECLAGYLATLQSRIDDVPVQEINHIVNYRGAKVASTGTYKPPPITSQGNIVLTIQSKKITADKNTSAGTYAQLMNASTRECLQPHILPNIVGLLEELYTRAQESRRFSDYGLHPGNIGISSGYKTFPHHAHFGFKNRVRCYNHFSLERYFRILPGNPIKHIGHAGDVQWENADGAALILFRVEKGMGEKVVAMFKEDMAELHFLLGRL